jgi:hypothetical protein
VKSKARVLWIMTVTVVLSGLGGYFICTKFNRTESQSTDPRYWPSEKWNRQQKTAVEGRTFANERIEIDGKSFTKCKL